jgi:hypothetical protein
MAKQYLPLMFTSLSRHSADADSLFKELVSNINIDNEVAKLRSALCTINRKHLEQIHIPIFRIKSLYQMVLSINQPHLTEDKIETRSDHLAISCIAHLVTASTFAQFQIFIQLKAQELEVTGCADACNFLASQEQAGPEFQLTTTMYLPKNCSMLDLASLEATNINELVINSTTRQGTSKENKREQKKTDRRNSKDSNRYDGNRRDNVRRFSKDRGDEKQTRGREKDRERQRQRGQQRDSNQRSNSGNRSQYSSSRENQGRRTSSNNRNGSNNRGQRGQQRDSNQRNESKNRGQRGQQRSTSRNRGSPVRLRGCVRCGSDNHTGDACPRFEYWNGPPCSTCGYLHKASLCPRFNKDRKIDYQRKGQKVNTTEIATVDQSVKNEQIVNTVGLIPNLFINETKN